MKQIISILLAVVIVFAFAACGVKPDDASNAEPETSTNAEETVLQESTTETLISRDSSLPIRLDEDGTVLFGSYPQTLVTDDEVLSGLDALDLTWNSYGYLSGGDTYGTMKSGDWMQYADATFQGDKYRAVQFSEYRPNWICGSFPNNDDNHVKQQQDNGYNRDTVYWFMYEPIRWKILDEGKGLLVSDLILDSQSICNALYEKPEDAEAEMAQHYQDAACTILAQDYTVSSIRDWLNSDFLNTAFSNEQKSKIITTTLNHTGPDGTAQIRYAGNEETNDSVFLLSWQDVTNETYGFNSDENTEDDLRKTGGTDYAKCQGLFRDENTPEYSWWYLRTATNDFDCICTVMQDGYMRDWGDAAGLTYGGVRPAICVELEQS